MKTGRFEGELFWVLLEIGEVPNSGPLHELTSISKLYLTADSDLKMS